MAITPLAAEFITGVPMNYGTFAQLFEGITSTIMQFLPLFIGIVIITIAARVVPYLIGKVMHG